MSNDSESKNRIKAIFKNAKEMTVSEETMAIFFDHLAGNLTLPFDVIVKGEDAKYVLDGVQESGDELYGLLGSVREAGDDKKPTMVPLCDIKAVDNRSANAAQLADYSLWFIENQ